MKKPTECHLKIDLEYSLNQPLKTNKPGPECCAIGGKG